MAESAAIALVRLVADPVLKKLFKDGFAYVGMDVPRELKNFVEHTLPELFVAIRASKDAPSVMQQQQLKPWLQKLKDTYDEAEDILTEMEYETIAKEVKHDNRSETMVRIHSLPLIKNLTGSSDKESKRFNIISSSKRKLWLRLNKLKKDVKDIIDISKTIQLIPKNPNSSTMNENPTPISETSSLPPNAIYVGRDDYQKHIVNLLLEDQVASETSYYVVGIHGIGGAGKTTLASHVYQDHKVVQHFNIRLWVSLQRKLNITEHTKAMVENASLGKDYPNRSTLEGLQFILKEQLSKSERTLLVLDDLWYYKNKNKNREQQTNEDDDWERLLAPFSSTKGLKVLLTSRSRLVPRVLKTNTYIFLEELNHADSFSLLGHYADLSNVVDQPLKKELEEISIEIVKKLSRIPLVIKAVAGQLKDKHIVSDWKNILENVDLKEPKDALMWTYQQLNEALQRCFLFCSTFPKGYRFATREFLLMWQALSYVRPSDTQRKVEVIANEYYSELVSLFFFQPIDQLGTFVIHDEFHDLAKSLTREECFMIENGQAADIPSTVRHLSIAVGNIREHVSRISKLERLQTLIFLQPIEEDSRES